MLTNLMKGSLKAPYVSMARVEKVAPSASAIARYLLILLRSASERRVLFIAALMLEVADGWRIVTSDKFGPSGKYCIPSGLFLSVSQEEGVASEIAMIPACVHDLATILLIASCLTVTAFLLNLEQT